MRCFLILSAVSALSTCAAPSRASLMNIAVIMSKETSFLHAADAAGLTGVLVPQCSASIEALAVLLAMSRVAGGAGGGLKRSLMKAGVLPPLLSLVASPPDNSKFRCHFLCTS